MADSDPAKEYDETLNKARALLRAAAMVAPGETETPAGAARGRVSARLGFAVQRVG